MKPYVNLAIAVVSILSLEALMNTESHWLLAHAPPGHLLVDNALWIMCGILVWLWFGIYTLGMLLGGTPRWTMTMVVWAIPGLLFILVFGHILLIVVSWLMLMLAFNQMTDN